MDSIPASRIKIVSVHAGSVNVEVEIVDDTPPVDGAVSSVGVALDALIASGDLNVGYGVNNATVSISDGAGAGAWAVP